MANPIPQGLHTITPQLTLDGAAEAMEFFKKAFGAEELSRVADPSGKKIWHASMRIGDSTFFLNDNFPEMGGTTNVSRLWVYLSGVDAAYQRAVDAGCKVRMPLADMFWGDRVGTVVDRWGNEWSLGQHMKDMSQAEMIAAGKAFAESAQNRK